MALQAVAVEPWPVTAMPASTRALVAPVTQHCRRQTYRQIVPVLAAEQTEQRAKRSLVQMAVANSGNVACGDDAYAETNADELKAVH